MISLFVEKETNDATLKLYDLLQKIYFPEGLNLTINNMRDAESGILREEGKVVDISLANCYSLEDVVRELVGLIVKTESESVE